MRRLVTLAAACTALISPSLASAQEVTTVKLDEVLSTAKAICFDNVGDAKAQVKAASAAPYNAKRIAADQDGTVRLSNGRVTVNVLGVGKKNYCMVSGFIEGDVTVAEGVAQAESLLGEPQQSDDQWALWLSTGKNGDQVMHGFMRMDGNGYVLASYAAGTDGN